MSTGDDTGEQIQPDEDKFIDYRVRGREEKNKLGSRRQRNKQKGDVKSLAKRLGVGGKVVGDMIEEEKKALGLKGSQHGNPTPQGLDFGDDTIHLDA